MLAQGAATTRQGAGTGHPQLNFRQAHTCKNSSG
jgi:hypothetical protein